MRRSRTRPAQPAGRSTRSGTSRPCLRATFFPWPCDTAAVGRFFNTTGPVVAADHYCIPPLDRLDLREVLDLVRTARYFVLHAPRQTGKTSALLALRDILNDGSTGAYRCVYVNVEVGQAMREDMEPAMRAILGALASWARTTLHDDFLDEAWPGLLAKLGPAAALGEALGRWSEAHPAPLVLLVDEIDALVGDTLLSVLRQLRAGYVRRPAGFPQSVVLCGVRDVRDYRIHSSTEKAVVAGGSAFNVKARSLRMGDFSRAEVFALMAQHTDDTGQAFEPDALEPSGRRPAASHGWSTPWPTRPASGSRQGATAAARSAPTTSARPRSASSCGARRTSISWPTSSRRPASAASSGRS